MMARVSEFRRGVAEALPAILNALGLEEGESIFTCCYREAEDADSGQSDDTQ